MTVEFRN